MLTNDILVSNGYCLLWWSITELKVPISLLHCGHCKKTIYITHVFMGMIFEQNYKSYIKIQIQYIILDNGNKNFYKVSYLLSHTFPSLFMYILSTHVT